VHLLWPSLLHLHVHLPLQLALDCVSAIASGHLALAARAIVPSLLALCLHEVPFVLSLLALLLR
jgi:hypothetical protein